MVLLQLLAAADVIVEKYVNGTMEWMGLGNDELGPRFPRLIYGSAKGYGYGTRWARLAAMDSTVQASSGFISVTGYSDRHQDAGDLHRHGNRHPPGRRNSCCTDAA